MPPDRQNRPLRIGFDLDGVILYNPARIVRPIFAWIRRLILKQKKTIFYVPQTSLEKAFWWLVHKSSLFPNYGYHELTKLIKTQNIKAYIITGRYEVLDKDFKKWCSRLEADKYFQACLNNKANLQPHKFKRQMIKKLGLDIFVEDNWDIIQLIKNGEKTNSRVKLFWIYNILDKNIPYKYKFKNLKQVSDYLTRGGRR